MTRSLLSALMARGMRSARDKALPPDTAAVEKIV
jgi:hypothetical protein